MRINTHKYNRNVKNAIKGYVLDEFPENVSLQSFVDGLQVKFIATTGCTIIHPESYYSLEFYNGCGSLLMNFKGGYVRTNASSYNIMNKYMLDLASVIFGNDKINKALMDSFREIEKKLGLR